MARRITGWEWPNSPAVNSDRKSTYSWPSRSHRREPSPRTMVKGNGSTKIAERVLPPGSAAQASVYCPRLFGLRARYCSCASASAAAMSILAGWGVLIGAPLGQPLLLLHAPRNARTELSLRGAQRRSNLDEIIASGGTHAV